MGFNRGAKLEHITPSGTVMADMALGLSLGQIAMRHGVSKSAVSHICHSSSDER